MSGSGHEGEDLCCLAGGFYFSSRIGEDSAGRDGVAEAQGGMVASSAASSSVASSSGPFSSAVGLLLYSCRVSGMAETAGGPIALHRGSVF